MNPWLVRFAVALFLPAIAFSWRHSRLVALAIAIPFVANLVDPLLGPSLPPDHPARVAVPLVSAVLGFVAAYMEVKRGRGVTRACFLGALVFALGGADIFALPVFAVLHGWYPTAFAAVGCLAIVAISVVPGRRFPWLKHT